MERPTQLDDYFVMVHDFLYKSFRDDCKLFLGLRSSHNTQISLKKQQQQSSSSSSEASNTKFATTGEAEKSSSSSAMTISTVNLSPRLLIREDGSSYGKVKIALGVTVPEVCDFKQKLLVGSDGKTTGVLEVDKMIEGLSLKGTATVNTIAPATEDESSIRVNYDKKDFYCSTFISRNGFGSTGTAVSFGGKFHDLILGIGLTRKFFSSSEADQREIAFMASADEDSQLYVGGGFHGKDWSFGARVLRCNDLWTSAELALFRKVSQSTAVACAYGFDLGVSKAHVTLGASQGFSLRVPAVLAPRTSSISASSTFWSDPVPFVGAVKADSFGNVLATVRGLFNDTLQWGLVVKRNLCDPTSVWTCGVQLTVEENA